MHGRPDGPVQVFWWDCSFVQIL